MPFYDELSKEDLIALLTERPIDAHDGVRITYQGKTLPWHITSRVKPRCQRIINELCVGSEEEQARNLIIEGENLQAMVSLYKFRGQVDLILTDPPYNTGADFRYNDRWDIDPNDPDLGSIVLPDDGARHTKWLRFMAPRLWMMKELLKPSGVVAICIDHRELYRLGMLMDEIFREENRLGIINWQKTYSAKNASNNLSTATEYVLIYAKDLRQAETALLDRSTSADALYRNPDKDPNGSWATKDITAKEARRKSAFAIQSPFTGYLHYPAGEYRFSDAIPNDEKHWRELTRGEMKSLLEDWAGPYEERDLGDGRGLALVIAGSGTKLSGYDPADDPCVQVARERALTRRRAGNWPRLYFRDNKQRGEALGAPRLKSPLSLVKLVSRQVCKWGTVCFSSQWSPSS